MRHFPLINSSRGGTWFALLITFTLGLMPSLSFASGGSGSGGGGTTPPKVDSIKVSKCYYSGGFMLIKASSSDQAAHLYVYLPLGEYVGEVQNGGGSRYGGTVTRYIGADPVVVTISSSSGGSITVPTHSGSNLTPKPKQNIRAINL